MSPKEIRELRDDAGLEQAELAELLEVSPPAVAQWEAGTTNPSRIQNCMLELLRKRIDQHEDSSGGPSLKTAVARATGAVGIALLIRWFNGEE